MNIKAFFSIIFIGILWGTSINSIRYCIQRIDPLSFIAIRFSITAIIYLIVSGFHIAGKSLTKDKTVIKNGVIYGIFGDIIPITLFVLSLNYQSSGISSILASMYPVMTVLLAHFFLPDERLNLRKCLGLLSSIGGVCIMALLGESGLYNVERVNLIGYLLVFIAAVINSGFVVYARKKMVNFDAWGLTSTRFITAAVICLPISLVYSRFDLSRLPLEGYFVLGYSGIVFFLGFLGAFLIIQRFGATTVALADYVTPIIATLAGWLFLGESISKGMIIGMVLIFIGLVLLNINDQKIKRRDLHLETFK